MSLDDQNKSIEKLLNSLYVDECLGDPSGDVLEEGVEISESLKVQMVNGLLIHGVLSELGAYDSDKELVKVGQLMEVIRKQREVEKTAGLVDITQIVEDRERFRRKRLRDRSGLQKQRQEKKIKTHDYFVIPKSVVIAALVMFSVITLTVVYDYLNQEKRSPIVTGPSEQLQVGTCVNGHQLVWGERSPSVKRGDRLSKNLVYELVEGSAQVVLDTGAEMIIESPSKFQLTGHNICYFEHGKVSALVPEDRPEASGFTINTKDVKAKDIGTEFKLRVTGSDTQLHVADGQVDASLVSQGFSKRVDAQVLNVLEGEAHRFNGKEAIVEPMKYDDKSFFSRWGDVLSASVDVQGEIKFYREAPQDLTLSEFESDDHIALILESSGVELDRDLEVDIDYTTRYQKNLLHLVPRGTKAMGLVEKGMRVTSFLLHLDPQGTKKSDLFKTGVLKFNSPIVGIIVNPRTRLKSDEVLGAANTIYENGNKQESYIYLEYDKPNSFKNDVLKLSKDKKQLEVRLRGGTHADQVRIIVGGKP